MGLVIQKNNVITIFGIFAFEVSAAKKLTKFFFIDLPKKKLPVGNLMMEIQPVVRREVISNSEFYTTSAISGLISFQCKDANATDFLN